MDDHLILINLILGALGGILFSSGSVIGVSVALLRLCKPQTGAAVLGCILGPGFAVALGLLWWGYATDFFGSKNSPPVWFVVTPALICAGVGIVTGSLSAAALNRRLTAGESRASIWKIPVTVSSVYLFSAIAIVLGQFGYLSRNTWKSSFALSKALRDARSVRFVEFVPLKPGELILAQKSATPEDVARFRSATSPWFLPYAPHGSCCFEPHHRVEIVRADGTALTFLVCFLCGNFLLDPSATDADTGGEIDLPSSWRESLSSFFASIGMTPKTSEEYSAFAPRDPNDQDAKTEL